MSRETVHPNQHHQVGRRLLKLLLPGVILGITSTAFAVDEFEVANLYLAPGHGENSADFESFSNKVNITHRILNPIITPKAPQKSAETQGSTETPESGIAKEASPKKQIPLIEKTQTRSAYSVERFNLSLGSGDQSAYSQTLKAYAEAPINKDLVVGGNLYVNTVTSSYFDEGFLLNNNIGVFGRYYIPGVPQDLGLSATLGYSSIFLDKVMEANVNSTWGHNLALSIASQFDHARFQANYGAQIDYFTVGYVQNSKLALAGQVKAPINSKMSAGFNTIYAQTLMFEYDSGIGLPSSSDDLLNTSQVMIGLLFDYALSNSFVLNLSVDQTVNLISHDNLVVGIGTDFGF